MDEGVSFFEEVRVAYGNSKREMIQKAVLDVAASGGGSTRFKHTLISLKELAGILPHPFVIETHHPDVWVVKWN